MRADTTLRPEKPPRAFIVSTGEDVPRGQSLRARMFVLELGPGEINWQRLTECQRDAAAGLYAQAMSGYVRWLAPRYEDVRSGLRAEHAKLRDVASRSDQHRRTAGIVADLALGLKHFLTFAQEAGALTPEQAEKHWIWGWKALGAAAAEQHQHQIAGEPTLRFRQLLGAVIVSKQAHVAGPDGSEPEQPEALGWQGEERTGPEGIPYITWRPKGPCIGWIDGEDLYLEPEASFAAVQKQGRDSGDALVVSGQTLRKRLHERGLLISTDKKRQVLTVRRTLTGSRREVLHVLANFLSIYADQPDQPDHEPDRAYTYAGSAPSLWSGSELPTLPVTDHEPDQQLTAETNGRVMHGHRSGNGRVPDQHKPLVRAENSATGRVGRAFDTERDNNDSEGACPRYVQEHKRHSEGDEKLDLCLHGYPGGKECYLCDPEHPMRREEGR